MEKLKGIIFDVDGTLASTNKLIFATFNYTTDKYLGKIFTEEELIAFFGPTEDVILKELTANNFENARKDYFKFYEDNHDELVKTFPRVENILFRIKEKNIPLGIFTGKGKDSTIITLRKLNYLKYFDLVVTGDDVKDHKPSPEGINLFLQKFDLEPENVLMIGDAPSDIKAAKDAGVKVASVVWDSYAKEEVLRMNGDIVFHSIDELEDYIVKNT